MLYKRVNLGITLNAAAILLALLALDWQQIPAVIFATTDYQTFEGRLAISIVLATFGIMLLSQLYKETKLINQLSESLSRLLNKPKIVLSVLPAVIGFLPVAGGALMSAPLVDSEAERLKLRPERKAYVNLWFRHTIFPVYPISQVLIVTVGLAAITMPSLIIRQIPVVIVMVVLGYLVGFWKANDHGKIELRSREGRNSDLKSFLTAFSPILATIVVAVALDLVSLDFSKQGFDVVVAVLVGILVLIVVKKPSFGVVASPLKSFGIYGITLAAYGAFLLKNTLVTAGVGEMFGTFAMNGGLDTTLLLAIVPAVLGMLTASALGGVTLGFPILIGIMTPSPRTASLIFMSAYLGYVASPTHLCFAFTADYFSCSMKRIYKYVIPSIALTFMTALAIYWFI
jgi:integral membrane protein (TIGR00529 family)